MENMHILQQLDVLRSFQIVKFIPQEDIDKINEEGKKLPKKDRQKYFSEKIQEISNKSIKNDIIPGILTKQSKALRTEHLLKYSINLAKEIQKEGMTKEEQSYVIMSLAKLLELKLKNFNKWKESQKEDIEDEDDDDDED